MNTECIKFSPKQISEYKTKMRKQIFFLLIIVDPNTKDAYPDINVDEVFENVMNIFGGYNSLMNCPVEMVTVLSILNAARDELHRKDFKFAIYRKLILDAGSEVLKIEEV